MKIENFKLKIALKFFQRGVTLSVTFARAQRGVTLSVAFARAQRGATSILMVFSVLSIILLIALTSATIMVSEIKMSQEIANSIPAFYASDAGAERCLYQSRCVKLDPRPEACQAEINLGPNQCDKNNGSITSASESQALWGGASYKVDRNNLKLTSVGSLGVVKRSVELQWSGETVCVPDCSGRLCGEDDGCGSPCPATCFSFPGCRVSQPANTTLASGSCCSGQCYQCSEGYTWDGTNCVAAFFDAETLDSLHWSDIKAYIDSKF